MLKLPFEKLLIWQKSMELVCIVYKVTSSFPREESFGLIRQMRDAAASIPSNIAEGSQRTTNKDFAHFIRIAKGSLAELKTQLLIARNLTYTSDNDLEDLLRRIVEIDKMIAVFHRHLIRSLPTSH